MWLAGPGIAQQFTDISAGLIEPASPTAVWGDYDNDGDLDLLVAGKVAPSTVSTILYQNTAGAFADSGISFLGLEFASAAWGDYDNDGDLDLAMIGQDASQVSATRLYRNDGGISFVSVGGGTFTNVVEGALAWGDYDNDGDLDLIVTGITASSGGSSATRLYRNNGAGSFTSVSHPFPNVHLSAVAWGDYDKDGDLDLMITGASSDMAPVAGALFRNDDGVFVNAGAGLPAVQAGFVEWGDYDSDGDPDLLLSGFSSGGRITRIYRNTAGVLTNIAAGLPDLFLSAGGWGDYDNDGDLDIMISGFESIARLTRLFRNDGGTFVNSLETFPDLHSGVVAWGNYDNDGDLDLVLAGEKAAVPVDLLRVYRNNSAVANTAPTTPGNLLAAVEGKEVTFSWNAASDGQTPVAGLSYSIRVGTTPGGSQIVSAQAAASGFRFVPATGNVGYALSATFGNFAAGTYYWSVQAVDSALLGSAFAAEGSFSVPVADPVTVSIVMEPGNTVRVTWCGSPGSIYQVEESSDLAPMTWSLRASPTADMTTGLFEIVEVVGPNPSPPRRYYRAVRP